MPNIPLPQSKTNESRHFKRVVGYARTSDYAVGTATAAAGPSLMLLWEKIAPSHVGKGGFAPIMRLTGVISVGAGFLMFYQRSIRSFPSPVSSHTPISPSPSNEKQSASTASPKTNENKISTCEKWSPKSKPGNPSTAPAQLHPISKE